MTDDDVAAYRLSQAERHIEELKDEIQSMRKEANDRERQRLKWGIAALGSVLIFAGSNAWDSVSHLIFRRP